MAETYRSRVYTERPAYADYDSARKFDAIQGIIITRLNQHPNAICSYSGGADDLELIRPYEPNVVKAAWNIFGESYEYRKKYNEYKAARMRAEKSLER